MDKEAQKRLADDFVEVLRTTNRDEWQDNSNRQKCAYDLRGDIL